MNAVIAQPTRDFLNSGFKVDPLLPQASNKIFDSRHESLEVARKSVPFFSQNYALRRNERFIFLKCKSCLRVKVPFVIEPKRKLLKLSAFKSNNQNDESAGKTTGSKFLKNSVGLSYTPQDSQASLTESSKPQSVPASSYTSESESAPGSLAIQNLFKSWLMLLRMPSQNHAVNGSAEQPSSMETSETQSSTEQKERVHILKAVWSFFWSLPISISISLVTFVPLYLAVNLKYGAEVTRELAPLWVGGPLIVALYIKLLRGIGALYVFSFKQTVKVIRNLPTYLVAIHQFIFHGKLNELVRKHLLQPLVDVKNLFQKEEFIRRMKELQAYKN
ncbi:OLC1v1036073C2 [Oldenlandia corymbosa var. corymbosa]|uniref:OLC1v1036073C2 n=1 Tax=Oldenlandia corymbosa var. corymbosa TaxID=529605 RepID=A0AAV1CUI4_OLDCO|nr:OLC1v1036073C2 [Oldenlandia corymbosa var. corymbosa]